MSVASRIFQLGLADGLSCERHPARIDSAGWENASGVPCPVPAHPSSAARDTTALPDRTDQFGIEVGGPSDNSSIVHLDDIAVAVVIRPTGFGGSFADPLNHNRIPLGDEVQHGWYRRAGKFCALGCERSLDQALATDVGPRNGTAAHHRPGGGVGQEIEERHAVAAGPGPKGVLDDAFVLPGYSL